MGSQTVGLATSIWAVDSGLVKRNAAASIVWLAEEVHLMVLGTILSLGTAIALRQGVLRCASFAGVGLASGATLSLLSVPAHNWLLGNGFRPFESQRTDLRCSAKDVGRLVCCFFPGDRPIEPDIPVQGRLQQPNTDPMRILSSEMLHARIGLVARRAEKLRVSNELFQRRLSRVIEEVTRLDKPRLDDLCPNLRNWFDSTFIGTVDRGLESARNLMARFIHTGTSVDESYLSWQSYQLQRALDLSDPSEDTLAQLYLKLDPTYASKQDLGFLTAVIGQIRERNPNNAQVAELTADQLQRGP